MYSARDARINEHLLEAAAPERGELIVIYRALQTMWRSHRGRTGEGAFSASDLDIASMCRAIDAREQVDERAVASGIRIFEELGFARVTGFEDTRRIEMCENPGHMALTASTRYPRGPAHALGVYQFRSWALDASARDMLSRIARPITPRAARSRSEEVCHGCCHARGARRVAHVLCPDGPLHACRRPPARDLRRRLRRAGRALL